MKQLLQEQPASAVQVQGNPPPGGQCGVCSTTVVNGINVSIGVQRKTAMLRFGLFCCCAHGDSFLVV